MKKILFITMICIYVICELHDGLHASAGCGSYFLLIDPSARTSGMGSCFTGVADDINSIHWNPAGLNNIENNEVLLSRNQWLADTNYDYFGYAENVRKIGILGLSLAMMNYGTINGRGADGYTINTFSAYDSALTLSYANDLSILGNFGNRIYMGVNLKFIRQMINQLTAHGVALDIGLTYEPDYIGKFKFGFALRNVGPSMKFVEDAYPLPTIVSVGVSGKLIRNLTTAVDLQYHKYNDNVKLNMGMEYLPGLRNRILIVRGGYQKSLYGNESFLAYDTKSGINMGIGLRVGGYEFDYSFIPYGDFGYVHRISFLWVCDEPVLRSWVEKIFGGVAGINKLLFTKLVEGIGFLGRATGVVGRGSTALADADEIGNIPTIDVDREFLKKE